MSEERLRRIVSDMEVPLLNLGEIEELLCGLLEKCPRGDVQHASHLSLVERNVSAEHEALKKLWEELHRLVFEKKELTTAEERS